MNDFLRRIRRLQKQLEVKTASVTVIYNDGTARLVGCLDAFNEVLRDQRIVDIKCADETAQSFFSALLEAEQEYGGCFDDLDELRS